MKALPLLACLALLGFAAAAQPGDKKTPPRVLLIAGSTEYAPEKTMPILKKFLESKVGCACTLITAKLAKTPPKEPGKDDLPGLENLDKCDVVILCTRRVRLQGEQLDRLKNYCTSGKPLIGIRTASHAIQTWLDLDKEVFGGDYQGHYKEGPLIQIKRKASDHAVLKEVKPYQSEASLYKNPKLADDARVVLTGTTKDGTEPIAWTRSYKGGRVFYTSLGHQKDFEEESFLRLIANAVLWTTQRETQIK
jgi:type 1 glutamine amidotransferase